MNRLDHFMRTELIWWEMEAKASVPLTLSDLRNYQTREMDRHLQSLVLACGDRFLEAAALLERDLDAWPKLSHYVLSEQPRHRLRDAWYIISDRYRREVLDHQLHLFRDPEVQVKEDWDFFVYRTLQPRLVADDHVLRDVLRAVGALPSRNPEQAGQILQTILSECALPDFSFEWPEPEDEDEEEEW